MNKNLLCDNKKLNLGYRLYLPDEMGTEPMPLIVFLHGAGERGDGDTMLDLVEVNGLPKYIMQGVKYPAIVLAPQCPSDMVWNNIVFAVKELIDFVVEEYNVDTDRISITGISMGGFGTWEMALTYPNFFSAIAPVCGGGMSWRTGLLKDMPIWAFHGDADSVVPIKNSVEMVDAVVAAGGNAKLTVFHNVAHDSWDEAYTSSNVVEWLVSKRRNTN